MRKKRRKIRYNKRHGGEKRGNNKDRAARKRWLLSHFGTGTKVDCAHCERELNYDTVTADRIIPGHEGGSYRRENIIPSCILCNKKRFGGELMSMDEEARAMFRQKKNPRRRLKIVKKWRTKAYQRKRRAA